MIKKTFIISICSGLLFLMFQKPNGQAQSRQKIKNVGGITFIYLAPGHYFTPLGNTSKDSKKNQIEKSSIKVEIKRGFYIAKFEITVLQYEKITGKNICKELQLKKCTKNHPAREINWYDAVLFCNKLSIAHNLSPYYIIDKTRKDSENKFPYDPRKWIVTINKNARGFRLPTTSQWEYAYRGTSKTDFYWGMSKKKSRVNAYAVNFFNSGYTHYRHNKFWYTKYHQPKRIGSRLPNSNGLYDMAGNVAEWCWNAYVSTDKKLQLGTNGVRILKGGSYMNAWPSLTAYGFKTASPIQASETYGIRLVLPSQ